MSNMLRPRTSHKRVEDPAINIFRLERRVGSGDEEVISDCSKESRIIYNDKPIINKDVSASLQPMEPYKYIARKNRSDY